MAIGDGPNYLELPPNLDARSQRRRVARSGEQWVILAEALVDKTISDKPGGLCRENVQGSSARSRERHRSRKEPM